jgi:hypothetical protein
MILFKEAVKLTAQQAWDRLVQYSQSWYGEYAADRPEIAAIKACMQVLEKSPKVEVKTTNSLTPGKIAGQWTRFFTVLTLGYRDKAVILVSFSKERNGPGMVKVTYRSPTISGIIDLD